MRLLVVVGVLILGTNHTKKLIQPLSDELSPLCQEVLVGSDL